MSAGRWGIIVLCGIAATATGQDTWRLASPDGQVTLTVRLADLGGTADYPAGKVRLYYAVRHGAEADAVTVVDWSPLGIVRDDTSFLDDLRFIKADDPRTVRDEYTMITGKRKDCLDVGREQVLHFATAAGARLELVLRAYDEGVAFRYRFPETDATVRRVTNEATGFAIPAGARCWMMPYDKPGTYTPAYEVYYQSDIAPGTPSPNPTGWALPALYQVGDGRAWALITESGLENYFGARLESAAPQGVYRLRMPDPADGNGTGDIAPVSTLPWATPWRLILVGGSLGPIVESTLVTSLARPSIVEKTDWIRPGRVAWSWWSDQDSPQDHDKLKNFIDLAAEMKWEYTLIDANWTIMKHGTVDDLITYAQRRNVGVLLWYNSGGPHNIVSERPRGMMYFPSIRQQEFKRLAEWGVKGVKVDFFQSDKQNIIGLYHDICRDAAEAKIMVNFHGCTIPRGWQRTYPHLMTMEAVRGEECYIFDAEYPDRAPAYNTIMPFTRNAIGSMDYTPVAFTDNRYPHRTTYGHELALTVVFESGWLHFADSVESYRSLPRVVKDYLKEVPVAWDRTRFIAGHPGRHVVIARRKGDAWYVGGINGLPTETTVQVPLSFLPAGKFKMVRITDGRSDREFRSDNETATADQTVTIPMRPFGGFVLRFSQGWF